MKLIVGLGNPGKKFEKTHHNTGFLILDEIRKNWKFRDFKYSKKFLAEISKGKFNGEKIILAKPQTFMNNSGKAVKLLIINYGLRIADLWVIHDDLDLPLGKIKISFSKGSGGHKGVQSIIDELKTKDFVRFRIGISPNSKMQLKTKNFVLEKFTKKEEKVLKEIIKRTCRGIEVTLRERVEKAMGYFNK